jgi:Enoyl-(Acyl carrier protein) reductase
MAEHRGTVLAVHVLAQANPLPDSSQAARQWLPIAFRRRSWPCSSKEVEGVQEGFRRLPTHKFRIGEKVQFLGGRVYTGKILKGAKRADLPIVQPKRSTIVDGRARKSYGRRKPMGTWEVFIKDHHEGYISWAEYERNQALLAGNAYGRVGDETAEQVITCNAVCPGYVYTPLVETQIEGQAKAHGIPREQVIRDVLLAQQPNKRFATVEELGALAVFLASEAAASITGVALPVDGGWTAH